MRFTGLIACIVVLVSSTTTHRAAFKRPANVNRYLQQYRYLAVELHEQTHIPIPIIIAVAGLESNWGESELALAANNHFGIKTKPEWQGSYYCKYTQEYSWSNGYQAYQTQACFRKYPLIRESYQDFGAFITQQPNYRSLQQVPKWNYRTWAEGLKAGGYATDPAYAEKLLRVIWRYRLYEV
ncbi:MAG: hypothetical protein D6772_01720 [Bacteroidetes bacterium]|nr:MAG: hypothetical protein D6772_01720 [Bacteroidota bacterium]